MQVISSKDNEFIKHVKKLKDKKYRDMNQEFVIEGIKLIREAIEENADNKLIVICDNCLNSDVIPKELMYEIAKYECVYVTEKIFRTITDVNTPQGLLAIIGRNSTENEINYNQDIIVALDDIQDPGNLGTILRTVDSIGLNQILVSKGTADCYNPKVVRSTMGAIFRIKIINGYKKIIGSNIKCKFAPNIRIIYPIVITKIGLFIYLLHFTTITIMLNIN